MKNSGTNKFLSFIKRNYISIILFVFLSALNVFFLFWSFKSNSLTFGKTFILLIIGSLFLEIILCLILVLAKKKNWPIEKSFLILGLIVGSLYTLALPLGRAPDEASHFFRIYEITEGHFISDVTEDGTAAGSYEPSDIAIANQFVTNNVTYADIFNQLGNSEDDSETKFISTSADSYSFISYLPHTIGMLIGKILHLPFLVTAYLAKFTNLVFCILILYFSMKYIPFLKKFIFFIAFLPINMHLMASLSADAFITTAAIALISFILYATYTLKSTLSIKHYLLITALCIVVSIGKIVYAPLCLLLFSIPSVRFGSKKRKIISIICIGALAFATYLIWHFMAPPLRTVSDSSAQLSLVIGQPLKYLAIFTRTIATNLTLYISGAFGGYLEWFNVVLSMLYIIPSFVVFVLLCVKERQTSTIHKSFKLLAIFSSILIVGLIFTALFIQWTKVGETIIDGVQGRYFLPIMLLIPIFFLPIKKLSTKSRSSQKSLKHNPPKSALTIESSQDYYLYGFILFESIYAILTIVCTHL